MQELEDRKYLVNWNPLINYNYNTFRIVRENLEKKSALATDIANSELISKLKEDYELRLDPKAFEENAPLFNFNQPITKQ